MTDSFVDLAGTRFHYRIDGEEGSPALVLSNSLGTDLSMWSLQIPALARRYRVVRYDTRGHGRSAVTPPPYTVAQLGRDVLGILDCLGIERAHFCGLSLGGMTGQWLAANAGYRIGRLVLANTTPRMDHPELFDQRIDKVRNEGLASIAPSVLERWFTPQFAASHPAELDATRAMIERTPRDGYIGACMAVRDMDQRDAIKTITRPTLVIAGTHDLSTPPANGRHLAQSIPGADYIELPAAHISNIEAADQFTAALLDFLP